MGTWTLKYEGLSLFNFLHGHKPSPKVTRFVPIQPAPAVVTPPAVAPRVAEPPAEAKRSLLARFADWIDNRAYRAEMREVDLYLSRASNIFDLEERLRRIERDGAVPRLY